MTGLYNRKTFFEIVEEVLHSVPDGKWCMMALDIEHFKLFNQWYGQDAGDSFLAGIARCLNTAQELYGGVAGYFGDDDFGILLPDNDRWINEVQEDIMECVRQSSNSAGFLPAFGMYVINDTTIPASTMYDRAVIAVSHIKGNYAHRVCWFDASMMEILEEEHFLLSEVQRGLEENEFVFYAQPQCNMATGKIVGAESLVRWNHKTRGMVPPGQFIPFLEKNGFIADLDRYIWREVCIWLRKWIDKGMKPMPVSVNVSRVDIYSMDVVAYFRELIETYDLSPSLIEIEITESAYSEDSDMIKKVVDDLRESGFMVLMDDFGSGYSSLNMLKEVNVDVLKIDMKFLEMNEQNKGKGEGIIEAVVNMANLLGMRIIVEGVETKDQMDHLLKMGGNYGQGYYFYRPLPIEQYEELLLKEDNLDYKGIQVKEVEGEQLDKMLNKELVNRAMGSRDQLVKRNAVLIRKNQELKFLNRDMPGGYHRCSNTPGYEFVYLSERFLEIFGFTSREIVEKFDNRFLNMVHPKDRNRVEEWIRQIEERSENTNIEYRMLSKRGYIYVIEQLKYMEYSKKEIFQGVVIDVTETVNLRKKMELLMEYAPESIVLVEKDGDKMTHDVITTGLFRDVGYDKERYEYNMSSREYRDLYSDIDWAGEEENIHKCMEEGKDYYNIFKLKNFLGKDMWVSVNMHYIGRVDSKPRALFVTNSITEKMQKEREIEIAGRKLESALRLAGINSWDWDMQNNNVYLVNAFQSERLSAIHEKLGQERAVVQNFPECIFGQSYIPEEYHEELRTALESIQKGKNKENICVELPFLVKEEYIWLRFSCEIVCDETGIPVRAIGYYTDITEQKEKELHLTKMAKTDALTGLYNRHWAMPKIKEYLSEYPEESAALIMFDLDNFKKANDMFGHAYGDMVIVETAGKIKSSFRGDDIVCRIGGDEFMVLCKHVTQADIDRKINGIVHSVFAGQIENGQDAVFSISSGYVMIPEHGREFDDLYEKADMALYDAKLSGKNSYRMYNAEMKNVRIELVEE